jgi:hypothetical protein
MKPFKAQRVSRSHTIIVIDEPGKVFSMFTPEEEKKWVPGWDYTPIYPQDGSIEKNSMFLTTAHDHAKMPAIWIVSNYKPLSYCIDYLRIETDIKIGKIEIACNDARNGKTCVSVTYTYTSLSDEGNLFLESFTDDYYVQYLSDWEKAINHYLKTGKMISNKSSVMHLY